MNPWRAYEWQWDDAAKDDGNLAKLLRRGIRDWEVEQIFLNYPQWRTNKKRGSGGWQMIGRTDNGRLCKIIVQVLDAERMLRAVTGWEL